MKDKTKVVMNLLYVLVILFILVLLTIFAPTITDIEGRSSLPFLFGFAGAFMVLGFISGILAKKWVNNKELKILLMIAGFSAGSFLILTVLHNLFYGVAEAFEDIVIVRYAASALEVVSFMVAIFVIPATFLIGVVGSLVVYHKGKANKN